MRLFFNLLMLTSLGYASETLEIYCGDDIEGKPSAVLKINERNGLTSINVHSDNIGGGSTNRMIEFPDMVDGKAVIRYRLEDGNKEEEYYIPIIFGIKRQIIEFKDGYVIKIIER